MLDVNDFKFKQIVTVFCTNKERISFLNDNLVVKDNLGQVKLQATCYRIFAIFIIGHTSITTGLIDRAKRFGFSIVLFTNGFKLYELVGFGRDANFLLHKKQYDYASLDIAKWLIQNKIENQAKTLTQKRILTAEDSSITFLNEMKNRVKEINTLQELLAYEGLAAKKYFSELFQFENWNGRMPRIKSDYINAILDIGYTVLFAFIEALLRIYGFDVYCGVMHTMFYMRKSLVCDIMEPFRPIIDYQVRKSIKLGQFKVEDFVVVNGRFELEWKKSSEYINVLLSAILKHKKEIFVYIRQYYRAFMQGKNIEHFVPFVLK